MKDIFLLDMDDTLLDFGRAELENLTATLGAFGISADSELVARFHRINDGLWKALERGEIRREALKVRRFAELFCEYGFSADPAAVSEAYFGNFPEICFPFRGAADFVKTLKNRGRVYICTNGGTQIQKRHLELGGFVPYLDGVFISEEVGADKPSREYTEYVRSHICGFCAERAAYVGDSLTSDLLCAKRLGADFVLFAPRGIPEGYRGNAAQNYEEALSLL